MLAEKAKAGEISMQYPEVQSRANKVMLVLSNFGFVISWSSLCVHLFQNWNLMDGKLRVDANFVLIVFPLLWISLLSEKTKGSSMVLAFLAFMAVRALVYRLV
jgi:hypothetical protein